MRSTFVWVFSHWVLQFTTRKITFLFMLLLYIFACRCFFLFSLSRSLSLSSFYLSTNIHICTVCRMHIIYKCLQNERPFKYIDRLKRYLIWCAWTSANNAYVRKYSLCLMILRKFNLLWAKAFVKWMMATTATWQTEREKYNWMEFLCNFIFTSFCPFFCRSLVLVHSHHFFLSEKCQHPLSISVSILILDLQWFIWFLILKFHRLLLDCGQKWWKAKWNRCTCGMLMDMYRNKHSLNRYGKLNKWVFIKLAAHI